MATQIKSIKGQNLDSGSQISTLAESIENIDNPSILVVDFRSSAMYAKYESLAKSYIEQDGNSHELFAEILIHYRKVVRELGLDNEASLVDIFDTFVEIEWLIEDEMLDEPDYIYDQIVTVGVIVASKILYHKCISMGVDISWLDVRGVVMTDNNYKAANVDMGQTVENIKKEIASTLISSPMIITQGGIGSTSENFTTTLSEDFDTVKVLQEAL